MTSAALLTLVASLLVRHHVPVHCQLPQGRVWPPRIEGMAYPESQEIYLRYCVTSEREQPDSLTVFAHELIHLEHPHWPHWKVYRWDDWYGRVVVGPKIRTEQRRRRNARSRD